MCRFRGWLSLRSGRPCAVAVRQITRIVLACRYPVLIAVALLVYVHSVAIQGEYAGRDWYLLVLQADAFASAHPLHALSSVPDLPTGPLTPAATAWLRHLGNKNGWQGACVVLFLMSLVLIWIADRAASRAVPPLEPRRIQACVFVGGCFVIFAWMGPAGIWGHDDDIAALTLLVVTAYGCATRRWAVAAIALGLAAAFKPWAFFFLPLAAVSDARKWRGVALALVVGLLPWLPFLIADRHSLDPGHFVVGVAQGSTLQMFGLATGTKVGWIRVLQPVLICALGVLAVRRRRWALLLWLGFSLRINLEPGIFSYYLAGPVVGAFIADLLRPRRIPAYRTILTWTLLYGVPDVASYFGASPGGLAITRIVARVAVLGLAGFELWRPEAELASSAGATGYSVHPAR